MRTRLSDHPSAAVLSRTYLFRMGSAGDSPLGDPPSGTSEAGARNRHTLLRKAVRVVPSGGLPDGTGESPVLPTRMGHGRPHGGNCGGFHAAFTLIEVLLAISIAIGILVVALYFYSRAADMRTQLLQESERISSIRLIMNRITTDLRCAYGTPSSGSALSGSANSLSIVKTEVPSRFSWTSDELSRSAGAETDLRRVSYRVTTSEDGTNTIVTGIIRTEAPLVEERTVVAAQLEGSVTVASEAAPKRAPEPLTDAIHFVRFRFWNGSAWQESWSGHALPRGVEVSLGVDPLPEGLLPDEYPSELFRRVIFLPGGGTGAAEMTSTNALEEGTEGGMEPAPEEEAP